MQIYIYNPYLHGLSFESERQALFLEGKLGDEIR